MPHGIRRGLLPVWVGGAGTAIEIGDNTIHDLRGVHSMGGAVQPGFRWRGRAFASLGAFTAATGQDRRSTLVAPT